MEKAMAPHSSTLAWRVPGTAEPSGLLSMGSLRVGLDWATSLSLFTFMHWRRKWQPTPLPSMGSHRVEDDWSDLAAAANASRRAQDVPILHWWSRSQGIWGTRTAVQLGCWDQGGWSWRAAQGFQLQTRSHKKAPNVCYVAEEGERGGVCVRMCLRLWHDHRCDMPWASCLTSLNLSVFV